MKPTLSVHARLTWLACAGVVLVWLLAIGMTWQDARHEVDELLDAHLAQAAALLVVRQGQNLEEDDDDRGLDAPVVHRYAPKVAFQVFHDGRLTLRSANAPLTPMVGEDRSGRVSGFRTVERDGVAWRVFATHGEARDVRVYVGEQQASRRDIGLAILRSMSWPMLVAMPLLMLAVWLAIRQGLLPLRQLRQLLEARQAQALDPIAMPQVPADLRPLLDALNGLFERIAALREAERRFTADAAHELRTPIAAIRAQAQVALAATDEAPRRHALGATLQGCDRATRLVEQLLTLSRLDADQPLPMQAVDLVPLARQVLADRTPWALAHQQTLALQADAPCVVRGDAALLGVLLRNLVDNATRYSPEGAQVHVHLDTGPHGVVLRVEDSGPGMGDADLARLGERFFRVLGHGQEGSGLGWSIVRRVAQVHQARLTVGRASGLGGLCVTLHWPAPGGPLTGSA